MTCPLCQSHSVAALYQERFFQCSTCGLAFKPKTDFLTPEKEKARYKTHENTLDNKGYVQFLTPVVDCVSKYSTAKAQGLDYGCGPQPVLALLLNERGFHTSHYDPFFFPEGLPSTKKFDFVTCTEAAEHFFEPLIEFEKIFSLLKADGTLVLMTEFLHEKINIQDWYYAKDPTHVVFYTETTLKWLAEKFSKKLAVINNRIAVFN